MKYRPFGRTGWNVSEIGLGAWAIGSAWGEVSEEDALGAILAEGWFILNVPFSRMPAFEYCLWPTETEIAS